MLGAPYVASRTEELECERYCVAAGRGMRETTHESIHRPRVELGYAATLTRDAQFFTRELGVDGSHVGVFAKLDVPLRVVYPSQRLSRKSRSTYLLRPTDRRRCAQSSAHESQW
jgi:hypothetical protein